eukprot:SAG22_NODE_13456_length_406_cov_0.674267_2_plen_34_part_01
MPHLQVPLALACLVAAAPAPPGRLRRAEGGFEMP